MPVKIRLQRKGRKQRPFYHIVVADARSPRDGRFIEKLGSYNPMTKPATIEIDRLKAYEWLVKGAQPTDTVRAILRFKGVLYLKHLMRGLNKGAMTQEQVDTMWQEWIDKKESKIASRRDATAAEVEATRQRLFGEVPVIVEKPVEAVVEVVEETAELIEEVAEEVAENAEEATESTEETTTEA